MRRFFEIFLLSAVFLLLTKALLAESLHTPPPAHKNSTSYLYTAIEKVGFVTPEPSEASALIIATDSDRFMITSGHTVYLKPEKNFEPHIGKRYRICSKPEEIDSEDTGYLHRISGIVEITDIRDDFAVGTVIAAFLPIHLEDFLLPIANKNPKIPLQAAVPGLDGKILANHSGQAMCAQGDVIYIDQGIREGVAPGQMYTLFEENTVPFSHSKKDSRTVRTPIGTILILEAEETASAALILDSKTAAFPGSPVGSPSP